VTSTRTPTLTRTPTTTPTTTNTPTITPTPTITRTPTPTVFPGPSLTYLGVANADDTVPTPAALNPQGTPIYVLRFGQDFSLVVEGRPGGSRRSVGLNTFNYDPLDPSSRPDLQVELSRALGSHPTADVCDNTAPMAGGVLAIDPPDFSFTQPVSDGLNDIGCRFVDGKNQPQGRTVSSEACTVSKDGTFRFVCDQSTSPGCSHGMSTIQFCGRIDRPIAFPVGDTVVTVLLRDTGGNLSLSGQMIIRVQP
jgi:hypothetical protein